MQFKFEYFNLNRGLAHGRKEGQLAGLNETASHLLSMGLSVKDVSKGTSLPLETVEEIKNKSKKAKHNMR